MKLPIKFLLIILPILVLFTGAVIYFVYPAKTAVKKAPNTPLLQLDSALKSSEKLKLERFSSHLDCSFAGANDFKSGSLADQLRKCAAKIFQEVLPENSALIMPLDVTLQDEYSAVVSCKAVIYSNLQQSERTLFCRVRVNYLADGSCEAEYPEFFSEK